MGQGGCYYYCIQRGKRKSVGIWLNLWNCNPLQECNMNTISDQANMTYKYTSKPCHCFSFPLNSQKLNDGPYPLMTKKAKNPIPNRPSSKALNIGFKHRLHQRLVKFENDWSSLVIGNRKDNTYCSHHLPQPIHLDPTPQRSKQNKQLLILTHPTATKANIGWKLKEAKVRSKGKNGDLGWNNLSYIIQGKYREKQAGKGSVKH